MFHRHFSRDRRRVGAHAVLRGAAAQWNEDMEAAAAGVPMVVVAIADNQRMGYRWARDSGVPGANAMVIDDECLAHQLRALIPAAMVAPMLENGAGRVAAELASLVLSSGPS